jgi:hypothetical protein
MMRAPLLAALLSLGTAIASAQEAPPADSSRQPRGASLLVFPFLFYQPETSVGGGAGLLRSYRTAPDARQTTQNLLLVVTARSQFSAQFTGDRYSPGNVWRVNWEASWSRFPDVFYGLGNDTRLADEEKFTFEHRRALVEVRKAVGGGFYLGGTAGAQRSYARKLESGGLLDSGGVTGGHGADVVALGVTAAYDSRDHLFVPARGAFVTFTTRGSLTALGADLAYRRYELDARGYQPLAGGVFAMQILGTAIDRPAPFFDLASLGGQVVLRGVFEGRYRDRSRAVAQLEWRRHVYRRLGMATFASAGQVAPDFGAMRAGGFHFAGGAGVRFLMSRSDRINARIDFASGPGGGGLYFGFGEAF